ncbi:hypothetical protein SESBI_28114 [Sesbania bispinosa]|nr:hypothetical protein SESBI_28114 [Sesbania bispinosa]
MVMKKKPAMIADNKDVMMNGDEGGEIGTELYGVLRKLGFHETDSVCKWDSDEFPTVMKKNPAIIAGDKDDEWRRRWRDWNRALWSSLQVRVP